MNDFNNPLDLDEDGDGGAFEMSILEEELKREKKGNQNSGCCIVILVLGSVLSLTGWGVVYWFV